MGEEKGEEIEDVKKEEDEEAPTHAVPKKRLRLQNKESKCRRNRKENILHSMIQMMKELNQKTQENLDW